MKEIPLSKGKSVLVDDEDYEILKNYKWHYNSAGYAMRTINSGDKIVMHRFIMNPPNGVEVDHIDRNKLDNRRANLRLVTSSQNKMNRAAQKNSRTSQYKGVCFQKTRQGTKRWCMQIKCMDVRVTKFFYTEKEAALSYNQMAKELFGEYAILNEVGDE